MVNPVSERDAQIHQRVSDGGHFPVQHADDFGDVIGVEHEVVVFVIAVHERWRWRGRYVFLEPIDVADDLGDVVGLGAGIAVRPAVHLAAQIPFRLAQAAHAYLFIVQAVQLGQVFYERLA